MNVKGLGSLGKRLRFFGGLRAGVSRVGFGLRVWGFGGLESSSRMVLIWIGHSVPTVDDKHPALPIVKNIP